jgi:hypothetical protein
MKKLILFNLFLTSSILSFTQTKTIDVTDQQSLKIKGGETKEFYYGFAAGDQIVFNLEVIDGNQLKQVEILEYPNISKFSESKPLTKPQVINKTLSVSKEGIYKFTISSPMIGGKTIKLKIQRIPSNDASANFNTAVEWKERYDTTYTPYTEDSIVGYDTTYVPIKKKVLKSDNIELIKVLDNHGVEVHSLWYKCTPLIDEANYGKLNEEIIKVDLPYTTKDDLQIVENLEWTYAVSVNQQMKLNAQKTKEDLLNFGGTVASLLGQPEFKVGFDLLNIITNDKSDQSVYCALIPSYNDAQLFKQDLQFNIYRQDNLVNTTGIRRESPLTGTVYIGLRNSNERTGFTVYVSCYVWRRSRTYEYVDDTERKITTRYVTLNKIRRNLNLVTYPAIMKTDPNAVVTYSSNNSNSNTQSTTNTQFSIGDSVAFDVVNLGFKTGPIISIKGENLLVAYYDATNKKVLIEKPQNDVYLLTSKTNNSNTSSNASGSGVDEVNGFRVGEEILFLSDAYIPAQNVAAKIIKFSSDKLSVDVEYIVYGKAKVKTVSISKLSKK